MRKTLRMSGWTLIGAAALVLLFLVYQLLVTDVINARSQSVAAEELTGLLSQRRASLPEPTTTTSTSVAIEPEPALLMEPALLVEPAVLVGEPLARMEIPRIELDAVVFEGTGKDTLKLGPGHMPETPLPGQPGNAVISGHRTTYGRPFYDLDQLVVGDEIRIETALGVNIYHVREVLIVAPTDVWVAESIPGAWLTLTTCHPRFSAAQRLIIHAELVDGPNLEYVQNLLASGTMSVG